MSVTAANNDSKVNISSVRSSPRVGVLYGLAAYGSWGLVPVYFKAVSSVPAMEVLAHRVVWSCLLLTLLVFMSNRRADLFAVFRTKKTLGILLVSSFLIALNWLVFIRAVSDNKVMEASLGYFINPLVNILLGFLFLKERMRPVQVAGLILAIIGVTVQTALVGHLPVISLILAFSFGLYGLLRKVVHVEGAVGLTVETMILLPFALCFIFWPESNGNAVFGHGSLSINVLLLMSGIITAAPLIWFANAARRVRLTTMGFMQYLAPTGHFLLAVLAYGEELNTGRLAGFIIIWTAILLYTLDAVRSARPTVEEPAAIIMD